MKIKVTTDGFGGEGDFMGKFGFEMRDQMTMSVARFSFEKNVGNPAALPRPREGDLIFLPLSNKFFEVMFVEHEQPFYQLSNLPVYRLQCALYEYNEEDFDTGIAQIDAIEETDTYQVTIDYSTTNNNHLQKNEKVKDKNNTIMYLESTESFYEKI